jgi:N-acetylmuramoyl-L-alanine amidase
MLKKMLIFGTAFLMLSIGAIPANAAVMHNIRNGESLYIIAEHNDITVNELRQANGLNDNVIYAGDKLAIPENPGAFKKAYNNQHDMELLARLITAEAGGEPFEGKVAVASVILNRIKDAKFPETIVGNIFKPHEFESVSNGQIWKNPSKEAYKAAETARKGWDPTNGAKYFFNPAKAPGHSWVWTRTIIDRIGNHVFGV